MLRSIIQKSLFGDFLQIGQCVYGNTHEINSNKDIRNATVHSWTPTREILPRPDLQYA